MGKFVLVSRWSRRNSEAKPVSLSWKNSSLFYPSDFVAVWTFINFGQVQKRNYKTEKYAIHYLFVIVRGHVVVAVSRVRLRDRGAWPGISQKSISHLASHFFTLHLAFLSRIFYLASRTFYLAFSSRKFFSSPTKSHLECPLQASVSSCCDYSTNFP